MIHKIAIRFRHWSSRATPGTPASNLLNVTRDVCSAVPVLVSRSAGGYQRHGRYLLIIYAMYILTPERISQGHVQNRRWATFLCPTLYNTRGASEAQTDAS